MPVFFLTFEPRLCQANAYGASKTPKGGHANPTVLAFFVPNKSFSASYDAGCGRYVQGFNLKAASSSFGCFEHPAFLRSANANSKQQRKLAMPQPYTFAPEEFIAVHPSFLAPLRNRFAESLEVLDLLVDYAHLKEGKDLPGLYCALAMLRERFEETQKALEFDALQALHD